MNRIPIIVGINGNLDVTPDRQGELEELLTSIFDRLKSVHEHSPLLVLVEEGANIALIARRAAVQCSIDVVSASAASVVYFGALLIAVTDVVPTRAADDIRPVFHIDDVFVLREIYPEGRAVDLDVLATRRMRKAKGVAATGGSSTAFDTILKNIDRYNDDLASEPVPEEVTDLQAFFDRTDRIANNLQVETNRSLRGLYIVGGFAAATQLVVQAPFPLSPAVASNVRIAMIGLAFIWLRFAQRKDFENRYQDYRALAEALRVQLAWERAGIRERLVENVYLRMQQAEMQWIRIALRSIYFVCAPASSPSAGDPEAWPRDQRNYYKRAARRQDARRRAAERTSQILYVAGAAVFLVALALSYSETASAVPVAIRQFAREASPWLEYAMTVPAALLGMIGLLAKSYYSQRGFDENARRYQKMYGVFDDAWHQLRSNPSDSRNILVDLGREALAEQAEWLTLHRARPIGVQQASLPYALDITIAAVKGVLVPARAFLAREKKRK